MMGRMKEQGDLFGNKAPPKKDAPPKKRSPPKKDAYARRSDPDTSHAAAKRVNVNPLEKAVLAVLRTQPGALNSKEIARLADIHEWSISPRMKPLEKKGFVIRDGKRDGQIGWRIKPQDS